MKPKIHAFRRLVPQPRLPRVPGAGRIVAILALACAGTSQALVWTGPGGLTTAPVAGTWDTTTANLWTATTGAGNTAWAAGPADFGGANGPITVTLAEAIPNVSNLNFNSSGYTLAATSGPTNLTLSGNVNVVSLSTATIANNVTVQKTAGSLSIGTAGAARGTLTINSGGTVKTTAGGDNTATYIQGNGTVVNVNGTFARTSSSTSSFSGSGDATHIANNASDNVTVNVNPGGVYSTGGRTVRIGSTGTAVMNIDGGTFSVLSTSAAYGHVYIGYNANSNATVNVTGGSFATNPGNPSGGGGQLLVGLDATSTGTLNVTDGTVTAHGRMVLGISSTNSTATLSGAGAIIATNIGLLMSQNAGSVSTFHLDGGTLTTTAIAEAAGESTFNLNGGTIKASADSTTFMSGLTRANVRDGGAIFDTNGKTISVSQSLLHSDVFGDLAIDGGLTKNGSGELVLTGFSSYTGQTTVNTGTLTLENVDLSDHAGTTIAAGGTLRAKGNISTAGTLSSLGKVDLTDATANTLTVGSTVTMTNSTVNVELFTAAADRITATGAATVSGVNTINLSLAPGQTLTGGNYTILSAAGGLNASAFTIGTRPAGFNQLTLSTPASNQLVLNVVGGNPTPSTAYWTGIASSTGSPANPTNLWGYGSDLAVSKSNWSTTANGLTDPLQVPGGITDVIFTATNATHVAGVLSTRLDAAYQVNGLTFDVPGATGITSTGIDTNAFPLTLTSGGVTLSATSGSSAGISGSGSVVIAGSQSWSNNNDNRSLGVTSGISAADGFHDLVLNGTGTGGLNLGPISNGSGGINLTFNQAGLTTLGGSLTYTGLTQINQGKILFNDIDTWTGTIGITISSSFADALTFHQAARNLVLPNVAILGTGGIVKTGAGTLTLTNGNNSYDKGTVINSGTLFVNSSSGQGTAGGQSCTVGLMDPGNVVTVNNGGILAINGTAPLGNSNFLPEYSVSVVVNAGGTINGGAYVAFLPNLTLNGGTINIGNGNTTGSFNTNLGLTGTVIVGGSTPSTISTSGTGANANASLGSNPINAAAGVNFQVANATGDAAVDLTVSSILRDHKAVASSLIKSGPGSMLLSAVNTYTGSTTVSAGELILSTASLADGADVFIGSSATLKLTHGTLDTVHALTIGGVQLAAGTYGPAGIANSHITGTGSLVVTTGPASGYETWSLVIPSVDDRGREDDPDGDGFNNISEYLFGTSPIQGNGSLVQTTASGSNLVVRWSQRNVGTFILQESSTLVDNPWPTSGVPVGNANDQSGVPVDYTRKEATVPINSAGKFVRVQGAE